MRRKSSLGSVLLLVLSMLSYPLTVGAQACGWCQGKGEGWCTNRGLDYPCHEWLVEISGEWERGDDPHPWTDPETGHQGGENTCAVHDECGGGLIANAEAELRAAVKEADAAVLRNVMARSRQAWFEFNAGRAALQILATCAITKQTTVVAHIPVRPEAAPYWARAAAQSRVLFASVGHPGGLRRGSTAAGT